MKRSGRPNYHVGKLPGQVARRKLKDSNKWDSNSSVVELILSQAKEKKEIEQLYTDKVGVKKSRKNIADSSDLDDSDIYR